MNLRLGVSQVTQHYLLCIHQTFTKSLGWHILSLNNHIGVGDLEPVGSAVGAIIASPFHDRFVNFSVVSCAMYANVVYVLRG